MPRIQTEAKRMLKSHLRYFLAIPSGTYLKKGILGTLIVDSSIKMIREGQKSNDFFIKSCR